MTYNSTAIAYKCIWHIHDTFCQSIIYVWSSECSTHLSVMIYTRVLQDASYLHGLSDARTRLFKFRSGTPWVK